MAIIAAGDRQFSTGIETLRRQFGKPEPNLAPRHLPATCDCAWSGYGNCTRPGVGTPGQLIVAANRSNERDYSSIVSHYSCIDTVTVV